MYRIVYFTNSVPITEVQLDVTFTPYETELFNDILRDFTTTKMVIIIEKMSNGDDVSKHQELLEEYQALIGKISKHCKTIQE